MTLAYLIAGEQSGDVLGARLMAAMKRARPDLTFAGVGGPRMLAEGLHALFPMHELAVMGLLEVLPRTRRLYRLIGRTVGDVLDKRPAVLVTIDSPGFSLRVLRRLKASGIPRVHYVAPQVWAWREGRVREYPGLWDSLLCLLPFEPEFFARHGLAAHFVGHPVLESGAGDGDAARFRAVHHVRPCAPVLVLMPGSRRGEVARLLPVFGRTVALLAARNPDLVPVLPVASNVAEAVRDGTARWPIRPLILTGLDDKHDAFAAAAVALTKSGTSTLELAMAGVPMAVTYRVNPLTAAIAQHLIKIRHAAMVNLLAGREVVPELIQHATPERLADTIQQLLSDPAAAALQRDAFRSVIASLSPPGGLPSEAAAREVLRLIRS